MEMVKPMIGLLLILSSFFLASHAQVYSIPDYDCRPYPPVPRTSYYKIIVFVIINTRGECQSIYEVARAPITSSSSPNFGSVSVIDSPVKSGPSTDSPTVGRMQGTLAAVDRQRYALLRNLAFVFNPQYYNGSTLLVSDRIVGGRDSMNEGQITGGTGVFRNPMGIVRRTVYSTNAATGETITRYEFVFDIVDP